MESFRIVYPSALLALYVKHYWFLETDDVLTSQRIIPTGNVELIFHRGESMMNNERIIPVSSISGQSFSFTDLHPMGKVNMIAVVFHPFGAKAFFNMPIGELADSVVSAGEVDIKLNELEDKILNAKSDDECVSLIENYLIKSFKPYKEHNYLRLLSAINVVNTPDENLSVLKLADSVCLEKKQLERTFNDYIGISPKKFMRIVRFQRALYILQNNPGISFTQLAYESGYYDQSHMTNEFKLFSGYSPTQYISICAPSSDYFSY